MKSKIKKQMSLQSRRIYALFSKKNLNLRVFQENKKKTKAFVPGEPKPKLLKSLGLSNFLKLFITQTLFHRQGIEYRDDV